MTTPAALQHGGVLPGVKAKPFGWPTASLDNGCGHHPQGSHPGSQQKQDHYKSSLHGFRGTSHAAKQ